MEDIVQKTLAEVVEFIGGTRRELLALTEGLTPAQLDYRPAEGRWSIGELLEHVAATEAGIGATMARLAGEAHEQGLPPRQADVVDLTIFQELGRRVAGVRFQAPQDMAPAGKLPRAELRARLETARRGLLELVPLLGIHDMTSVRFPHPLLEENFNLYLWLFFLGVHEVRHRRQIENVKQEAGFPG